MKKIIIALILTACSISAFSNGIDWSDYELDCWSNGTETGTQEEYKEWVIQKYIEAGFVDCCLPFDEEVDCETDYSSEL